MIGTSEMNCKIGLSLSDPICNIALQKHLAQRFAFTKMFVSKREKGNAEF